MVKFYNATGTHHYPFPTVTLAYFLRYPNPYSTHVLSTDTIARRFDPESQRLYTTRLHIKRSRVPSALLAVLPKSLSNSKDGKTTESYILEESVVDVRTGVMCTESKNLEFTGILSAREMQLFSRPDANIENFIEHYRSPPGFNLKPPPAQNFARPWSAEPQDPESTQVSTMVELKSRLGEVAKESFRKKAGASEEEDAPATQSFFQSWTTGSLQRTIESFGLRRTERAVPKAKQGMNVVLERLRKGGLVAVLEGMKKDREMMME